VTESLDPVLVSRARINRWVSLGLRVGYGSLGLSLLLFLAGFPLDFPERLTLAILICLIAGSVVLAPSIVFSYAVKAADRADREGSW
jgi:hypothetical protein